MTGTGEQIFFVAYLLSNCFKYYFRLCSRALQSHLEEGYACYFMLANNGIIIKLLLRKGAREAVIAIEDTNGRL